MNFVTYSNTLYQIIMQWQNGWNSQTMNNALRFIFIFQDLDSSLMNLTKYILLDARLCFIQSRSIFFLVPLFIYGSLNVITRINIVISHVFKCFSEFFLLYCTLFVSLYLLLVNHGRYYHNSNQQETKISHLI